MHECTMFNNGKSESGSAGFFGMTLIYTVKALKDPLHFILRNPDTRILHNDFLAL